MGSHSIVNCIFYRYVIPLGLKIQYTVPTHLKKEIQKQLNGLEYER